MNRRDFLKSAAVSSALLATESVEGIGSEDAPTSTTRPGASGQLPKRDYGKTGVKLSLIGLGGMVVTGMERSRVQRVVADAVERGVNYFDVAPTYGDAEERLGPALEAYRKDVFLACKSTQRGHDEAKAEFQRSLQRLRTDHFDLYQLHALTDLKKDVDVAFAKGGVMEWLIAARKAGLVRFLGFSAHSVEAAKAAMSRFDFDSILFPVNFATFHKGNFGPQVIEQARAKGMAVLALKALARQRWPEGDPQRKKYPNCWYQPLTDPQEAELGLRFTLSQPVTAAIPPGDESLFRLALDLAARFKPLSEDEQKEVKVLAAKMNPIFTVA